MMTPEQVYFIAFGLYKGGKYSDALGMFRLLSRISPDNYRYIMGYAACLQLLKKYNPAITNYLKCSKLDPLSPIPPIHIAECYLALNDNDMMIKYLNQAKMIALKDKKFENLINQLSLWEASHARP